MAAVKRQKIVLKLDLHDNKHKQKAIRAVNTLQGIDEISVDMKDQKMTVIGTVDPCDVMEKLRGKDVSSAQLLAGRTISPPACPEEIDGGLLGGVRALYEDDHDDGPFDDTNSNRSAPTDTRATRSPDLHVPSDLETMLQDQGPQDQSSRPRHIPLQDLKEITDNFSDERILGQGGFGVVYKGILWNGKMVAVKKIASSLMPGLQKQFESEVYHLMMLKHPNIVRCIGYCYETRNECLKYNGQYVFAEMAERLLCLEYIPKGSLDKYLSDESSGFDWVSRYKIIKGICYGLCHLHDQTDKPIIHMDLKPANILLDDKLVPKITDFGLSRLFGQQQTICTSSCVGTFGYMAPEFLHGGIITPKLDIFSLGVIIIEITTGHRDYPHITGTSSNDFIELALEKWRNVLQRSPWYESLEMFCHQIKRCIEVGLICVNLDRTKRPPIAKIIKMLQEPESIDCIVSIEVA